MKVFDNVHEGSLVSFEVSSSIGRLGAFRVLTTIPGVRVTKAPPGPTASFNDDIFCVFEVNGVEFIAEEPFCDNSRFLIYPNPPRAVHELEVVRKVFLDVSPWRQLRLAIWPRGKTA